MKYILITGGAGYIGSHIAYNLIDKKYRLVVIDNLSNASRNFIPAKAIFEKIDITDFKKLSKCFKKYSFDAIFHIAAKKYVEESQIKPLKYFKNNVIGTKNILDLMVLHNVKKLIFSSTCAVYGNTNKSKVSETENTMPRSYYGLTKLISENLIKDYQKKYNIKFAILRYFNVVGADKLLRSGEVSKGSLFKNLSQYLIKRKKKKFYIFGNNYKTKDGTCVRDFIDVNDLAELHFLSLKYLRKNKSFLFNCGYNDPLTVLDIINEFKKISKQEIKLTYLDRRKGDIESIYCENKLLLKIFKNWKRQYTIEDSIKNTLKFEKKYF
jgi:UDP-glucose 4-epimerase